MGQQVADAEHRIRRIFADADFQHLAALLHHDAVERQRGGSPLVLAYAPIVMGLEQRQITLLVERAGL